MSHDLAGFNRAIKFVALSGLGWVLDTLVYLALVYIGTAVLLASCTGGLCGASVAFLTSSRFVFDFQASGLPRRFVIYLVYTLVVIGVSAGATQALASFLVDSLDAGALIAAFSAKCLITPAVLAANFLVARRILQTT
jgi:putative flippase GtrA